MMDANYSWIPDYSLASIEAKLNGDELWKQFHKLGTEMIITKTGRRMFPTLKVEISGMEPSAHYDVYLEFVPASNCRFKYSTGTGWVPAGSEESHKSNKFYKHPDSPASGSHWMSQLISFGRVKLTNTMNPPAGQVVLSSMHKYQPRLVVVKIHSARTSWANSNYIKGIDFPETQFIAVTAYQNEEITKLKIDHNPFAKGFRVNGQAKSKRKGREETNEEDSKHNNTVEIKTEKLDSSDSTDCSQDLVSSTSSTSSRNATSEEPSSKSKAALTCFPNYFYPLYNYHPYEYPLLPPSYNTRPYCYPSGFAYTNPWSTMYGFHITSPSTPSLPPIPPHYSESEKPKKLTDFSIRAITGL